MGSPTNLLQIIICKQHNTLISKVPDVLSGLDGTQTNEIFLFNILCIKQLQILFF